MSTPPLNVDKTPEPADAQTAPPSYDPRDAEEVTDA